MIDIFRTNECWLKNTTSVTLFADPYYTEEEELESASEDDMPVVEPVKAKQKSRKRK